MPQMKCLGLLGSQNAQLCGDYERHILRELDERYAGKVVASYISLTLHRAVFAVDVQTDIQKNTERVLDAGIRALRGLGADAVVICSSELQPVAERMPFYRPAQLMADVVVPIVALAQRRRVAVVGAVNDEEERFWRRRMSGAGTEALFPVALDRRYLASLVANEFARGISNKRSMADVRRIVYGLRQAGARALVLLSPELRFVLAGCDPVIPTFDGSELHALAALDWALGLRSEIALAPECELPSGNS